MREGSTDSRRLVEGEAGAGEGTLSRDPDAYTMVLDNLAAKLRCPECRGRLTPAASSELTCRDCGRVFPSVRGTPCLLPDEALELGPGGDAGASLPGDITEHSVGGDYHWRAYGIDGLLPIAEARPEALLHGCGDAGERARLEALGFRVSGFDIRWSPGTDFVGDAHQIPLADATYDLVLSMQVLEHLHSPWIAVEEVARVLRPGGWFVGSVAFLKPFHSSYFHISHHGVTRLLEGVGFEIDTLFAAQSPTYTLFGALLPIGPVGLRRKLGAALDGLLYRLRASYWSATRHFDPDEPTGRFGASLPLTFRAFDRLRFAPAVVFRARKPPKQG
jgi:SAM-dependent methyltransferase